MDANHNGYPDFNPMLPNSYQFLETPYDYQCNQLSSDFEFFSHQFTNPPVSESVDCVAVVNDGDLLPGRGTSVGPELDSLLSDDGTVFKFVNKMLMEEENIELNDILSNDPLDFHVTERSFYDILGQQYPMSPIIQPQQKKQPLFIDQANLQQILDDQDAVSSDSLFSRSSSDVNASSSPSTGRSKSGDSQSLSDFGEHKLSILQKPLSSDGVYKFNSHSDSNMQSSVPMKKSLSVFGYGMSEYSVDQFHRGLEEANKFLPKVNPLVIDLKSSRVSAEVQGHDQSNTTKKDRSEKMNSSNWRRGRRNSPSTSAEMKKSPDSSRGRKNPEREDVDSDEGRPCKQPAIYKDVMGEEEELSELFDNVLLFKNDDNVDVPNEKSKSSGGNGHPVAFNIGAEIGCAKKQGKKKETVDLRNLLILCAQAVSINDLTTATELLKQIRRHASPFGDGFQRLAHCFANGLEARMTGDVIKPQICYNTIASRQTALDMLKGYQLSFTCCPIEKLAIFFMNTMIMEMAEKATTLHIIDFGIMYGFQWPILIQKLSKRPGGPPKLRITGIEVPQDGFRPTEWIENTGGRLAKYCTRFNVPFEFNPIASQRWDSIKVEDLKIDRNEMLAVNCMTRFKNLPDETVEENSPRDSVLKLIRSLKPDIFTHSIINGAYNSPFFVPRFREALFHYSAVFEAFDLILSRHDPKRFQLETEFYGVEAMNVIACEGAARNERAETYKQWQVRSQRAGLKLLPLNPEITKSYRDKFKEKYHKDYKVEQGGDWLLQGWKGRIVYATSCWVPA